MLQKIANWIESRVKKRREPQQIRFTKIGFSLYEGDRCIGSVEWDEVEEIVAFKTDEFTYDTVWLEFVMVGSDEVFSVNDEVVGFWELVDAVKKVYPDSSQDWESRVIKPAFARNQTRLYKC